MGKQQKDILLIFFQRERKAMEKYIDENILEVLSGLELFGFKKQETSEWSIGFKSYFLK